MMIRTNVEISNSLFTDLPRDNSNYIDTVTDNIHYFNAMFQFTYSIYDTHFMKMSPRAILGQQGGWYSYFKCFFVTYNFLFARPLYKLLLYSLI